MLIYLKLVVNPLWIFHCGTSIRLICTYGMKDKVRVQGETRRLDLSPIPVVPLLKINTLKLGSRRWVRAPGNSVNSLEGHEIKVTDVLTLLFVKGKKHSQIHSIRVSCVSRNGPCTILVFFTNDQHDLRVLGTYRN